MFKWVVNSVTDTLIAFILATVLLWYGAVSYPEFFPKSFHQYWGVAKPEPVAASIHEVAVSQVSAAMQVQH
ncbi:hypothetical protein [Thiothrix nivea]|uniref:Uncharacterized protein n=1 Tax=Thiothrix nivea (strain ATCC 35100 / DSM 5205 / JP2) TaxID=870187 RepID=A0A656HKU7_THINJ|nr:hypothetical protein [Thiothrix nivea]EIJ35899.1 hypothetical protein Thini_3387 [Thiothrix nivea DSM 5205]